MTATTTILQLPDLLVIPIGKKVRLVVDNARSPVNPRSPIIHRRHPRRLLRKKNPRIGKKPPDGSRWDSAPTDELSVDNYHNNNNNNNIIRPDDARPLRRPVRQHRQQMRPGSPGAAPRNCRRGDFKRANSMDGCMLMAASPRKQNRPLRPPVRKQSPLGKAPPVALDRFGGLQRAHSLDSMMITTSPTKSRRPAKLPVRQLSPIQDDDDNQKKDTFHVTTTQTPHLKSLLNTAACVDSLLLQSSVSPSSPESTSHKVIFSDSLRASFQALSTSDLLSKALDECDS